MATQYKRSIRDYAPFLGMDARNLTRYVTRGKKLGEIPPLDNPPAMLDWWSKHIKRQAPEGVLQYASRPPPFSDNRAPDAAKKTVPPAAPVPFDFQGPGGFSESVRELRMTVAAGQARLRRAMQADILNEGLIASCQRGVREGMELLRKSENDLFDLQRKRSELLVRAEVIDDWRTLLAGLRQMRRRMGDNIGAILATNGGFTPEQIEMVRSAVAQEREREDQLLRGAKHWREVEASGHAAA